MKEFRDKVLRGGASTNPILALAQKGLSPAEFKTQIIEAFAPYFTNHDLLERFAIDVLPAEAVNLGKVRSSPVAQIAFDHARALYLSSERRHREAAYRCFAHAETYVAAGRSEFWSLCYLERPTNALGLHEFKHEIFRAIGTLVESCLQPILRDLLGQLRISRGRDVEYEALLPLPLGNIVGKLHDVTGSEIYAFGPWAVRLNQWRNMAQHYRTSVRGDRIIGWYGEPSHEKTIELSRDELMSVLRSCIAVFDGARLGRSLFGIDRIREIKPFLTGVEDRPEVNILSLVTAMATQGFEATNVEVSEERAEAWLRDHRSADRKARMVHASQFVHVLWTYTEAAEVLVHYCDANGCIAASFSSSGENCELFSEGTIDLATYVNRMSFKVFDQNIETGHEA